MRQKFVKNGDVEINTEAFGDLNNPKIVLIMGATAQGLMWQDAFCNALASKGYCVIRYDHRDTGKSTRIDYKVNPYTLEDLAKDVLEIIKEYSGGDKVHLIGASMGSFVAQTICLKHPEKVATLTCVMSSPNHMIFVDGFEGRDTSKHPLPPSNPKILEFYQEILSVSAKDVDEDLAMHKEIWKKIATEESAHLNIDTRVFEGKILKRLKNPRYIHNHSLALVNSEDLFDKLKDIKTTTLVIHGTDDYVLPFEHGELLSKMIPNSTFIPYEGMGHCLPAKFATRLVDDVVSHILAHK